MTSIEKLEHYSSFDRLVMLRLDSSVIDKTTVIFVGGCDEEPIDILSLFCLLSVVTVCTIMPQTANTHRYDAACRGHADA
jgi:hypothetical protein